METPDAAFLAGLGTSTMVCLLPSCIDQPIILHIHLIMSNRRRSSHAEF